MAEKAEQTDAKLPWAPLVGSDPCRLRRPLRRHAAGRRVSRSPRHHTRAGSRLALLPPATDRRAVAAGHSVADPPLPALCGIAGHSGLRGNLSRAARRVSRLSSASCPTSWACWSQSGCFARPGAWISSPFFVRPVTNLFGFPAELVPLALNPALQRLRLAAAVAGPGQPFRSRQPPGHERRYALWLLGNDVLCHCGLLRFSQHPANPACHPRRAGG